MEKIALEAARMGYEEILIPAGNVASVENALKGSSAISKTKVVGVSNIHDAIKAFKN